MVKNPPSNAGDAGSIPGQGTKTPQAMGRSQKKKKERSSEFLKLIYAINLAKTVCLIFFQRRIRHFKSLGQCLT